MTNPDETEARTNRKLSVYEYWWPKVVAVADAPVAQIGSARLTLAQLFERTTELLYQVDIASRTRRVVGWMYPEEATLIGNWYRPKPGQPATTTINVGD